jgi:hypothetical protein
MGPRNRRRLAVGAGVAGVIVAVVAVALLTRTASPRAHALSATRLRCVPEPNGTCYMKFGGIVSGMTENQVRRVLGKPEARRGRCWLYSQPVSKYEAARGVVKSDVAVCFFGGRYSDESEENYVRRHGKLVPYHPRP